MRSPHRRAVIITGKRGTGKTSLALMFAHREVDNFPGGIIYADTLDFWRGTDVQTLLRDTKAPLLILDEVQAVSDRDANDLVGRIIRESPLIKMILITQARLHLSALPEVPVIVVGNFTELDVKNLVERLLGGPKYYPLSLYRQFKGRPLITKTVLQAVSDGLFDASEALNATEPFQTSGILGPDGHPLEANSTALKVIVSDVTTSNDEFLRRLADDPKSLYTLSPRSFEEVVAGILKRLGYEVELTPATRDGGKDIYAAHRTELGTFLYLVECKKFSPDHPVGVGLIRNLYGSVEAEKANGGILATTSFFTQDAREFQTQVGFRISLQDYLGVHKWLMSLKQKCRNSCV
jgi:restriction system protein